MNQLSIDDLLAQAKIRQINLGRSPRRRLTYLVTLGLLPPPVLVSEGYGKGVHAVFSPAALGRLMQIQRLTSAGLHFHEMSALLKKRRSSRGKGRLANEESMRREWMALVGEQFRNIGSGDEAAVVQALRNVFAEARKFDEEIGVEDEFDRVAAQLYLVGRAFWVLTRLLPEARGRAIYTALLSDLRGAFRSLTDLCGVKYVTGRPPVPRDQDR